MLRNSHYWIVLEINALKHPLPFVHGSDWLLTRVECCRKVCQPTACAREHVHPQGNRRLSFQYPSWFYHLEPVVLRIEPDAKLYRQKVDLVQGRMTLWRNVERGNEKIDTIIMLLWNMFISGWNFVFNKRFYPEAKCPNSFWEVVIFTLNCKLGIQKPFSCIVSISNLRATWSPCI